MDESKTHLSGTIPHSRPLIGRTEASAVANILQSGQIAQGSEVHRFEDDFVRYLGGGYAAAVSSGTAALHLVLAAMGIGEGDEVVMPSFVCTALLNAVNYVGGVPVLADIDPASYNLSPSDVEKRLSPRTKAIIAPHMFGGAVDMKSLSKFGIPMIEDCAQSVGGDYRGRPLGTIGAASIFSFYATKVITSGEGGMVYSSDKGLIDRVRDLRDYDGRQDYKVRFNYKMTDVQAAIARVQLSKLEAFIERRRNIALQYFDELTAFKLKLPEQKKGHIYYRFLIQPEANIEMVLRAMTAEGVGIARPVNKPLHRYLGTEGFPETEMAWERTLSVPIYPSLTDNQVQTILKILTKSL